MNEEIELKGTLEVEPGDVYDVSSTNLPKDPPVAIVTLRITKASPADLRFELKAEKPSGAPLPLPTPNANSQLSGSVDLDFTLLGLTKDAVVEFRVSVTDPTTEFSDVRPFTTNKASRNSLFLKSFKTLRDAILLVNTRKINGNRQLSYNMHFVTINAANNKPVAWVLDPKVRNEG